MTIIFLLHYYLERYGKTSPISPIIWICVCLHHSVVSHSLKTLGMCPPGFSVHGILQARILKYVAILFLLKKSIYFNWRLITLQYCSDFCDTLTWISHGCTCVPHHEPPPTFLPIPSLRVIPVHHPWAPCLMHWTWTGDLRFLLLRTAGPKLGLVSLPSWNCPYLLFPTKTGCEMGLNPPASSLLLFHPESGCLNVRGRANSS